MYGYNYMTLSNEAASAASFSFIKSPQSCAKFSGEDRRRMMMLKRIKKAINRFFDKLAKENEKSFGKGTLDCCQLNRQSAGNNKK